MAYNLEEVPELLADIAVAMGAARYGDDPQVAGRAAVDATHALPNKIGLTQVLRDLNVDQDQLKECAELSMSDGSIIYNPRMVMEPEEVLDVYMKAF